MSAEATEAVEPSAEQTLGAAGSEEPSGAESAEAGQSPDFGDQVDALRGALDAQEGDGGAEEAESLPDDQSLVDYLAGQLAGDESGEEDGQGIPEGEPAGEPADEDQFVAQLDAYIDQVVQERLSPVLSSMERDRQEGQLRSLADKYEDLRTPAVLDAIGARLGPLAEARQDESLLADPQLVELAYLAHKAEAAASAERPAQPDSGAALEKGSPSKPAPSQTPEEAIQQAIVGASGGGDGARGLLY